MKFLQPCLTTFLDYPLIKAIIIFIGILFNKFIDSLKSQFLGTVILLVIFDTITGFCVAAKKKKVSSWGWSRAAIKLVNYCILLSIGKLTGEFLLLTWLNQILVMFIVTTEIISIFENISMLQPKLIPKKIINLLAVLRKEF